MDVVVILCLLAICLLLAVGWHKLSEINHRLRVTDRYLDRMTQEQWNELCEVLKAEGIPSGMLESFRQSGWPQGAKGLATMAHRNPSSDAMELIQAAQELIEKQSETGNDFSVGIRELLDKAKIAQAKQKV